MLSKELKKIREGVKSIEISNKKIERDRYYWFYFAILLGAFFRFQSDIEIPNMQIAPLYKEAIKAVDPLDLLKEGEGAADYVTF